MKTCTVCAETKPIEAFPLQPKAASGRHQHCKSCRAAYLRDKRNAKRRFERGFNEYWVDGDVAICETTYKGERRTFLVSATDLPKLIEFNHRWQFTKQGYIAAGGKTNYVSWNVKLHRFLMDFPSGMTVDHINFDKSDNRRSNLRIVSLSFNCSRTPRNIAAANRRLRAARTTGGN